MQMKVTPVPLEASICVSEGCYFPLSLMPLQPQWNPALSWVRLPSARVGWGTQTLALKPLGPLLGTPHCTPRPCTGPSRRPQPSSLCRNVLPAPCSHLLLLLRPLRTFQSILAAGRLADPQPGHAASCWLLLQWFPRVWQPCPHPGAGAPSCL